MLVGPATLSWSWRGITVKYAYETLKWLFLRFNDQQNTWPGMPPSFYRLAFADMYNSSLSNDARIKSHHLKMQLVRKQWQCSVAVTAVLFWVTAKIRSGIQSWFLWRIRKRVELVPSLPLQRGSRFPGVGTVPQLSVSPTPVPDQFQ